MPFVLTSDQLSELREWKYFLETDESKQWHQKVTEASESYNKILSDSGFDKGKDLSGDQIDDLFRKMKKLSGNQGLQHSLYDGWNNPRDFNSRLRDLLFGQEPIANRIDQFLELKRVQEATTSQFLCLKLLQEYPFITGMIYDVLQIDSTQEQDALKDALQENSIEDQSQHKPISISYLQHSVIFREIKRQLNLTDYSEVNIILRAPDLVEVNEPELETISSISIEKDLSDYIAKNPHIIGKGLALVGREYQTDVGRIDVLLKDKNGKYVVVETKKGRESDKVVGQTSRYVGWIRKNMGDCDGVIVVGEKDERLEYAVIPLDFIKLKRYEVEFKLFDY